MSESLRVAMVAACPFPWPRGTPIRIHRMAEALARRGHEVHVVTYHLGEVAPDAPYVLHRIRDVPSYRNTAPGPTLRKLVQLDPALGRLLRRLRHRIPFDVVHGHHYEGLLVASRAGGRAPVIYDAHTLLAGELPHYPLGLPAGIKRVVGAYLDRRLPRRADRIIAVTGVIRETLIAHGVAPHDRIHVIANGVDCRRFRVEGPVRRDGRTVIFTGTLAPYQGIELMIEAFATLRARRPVARLLVVTRSSFEPYESLARMLGVRDAIEVRDAPFADEPGLLAGAAVAVNPRTACDGLPQKLLNYMAAGMPIVSFDGSAVHLEHERTGLRVPDGDTAALAAAIERLLDDEGLARRLGEAARERVADYDWSAVARRVEAVYREAMARPPSSSRIGAPAK